MWGTGLSGQEGQSGHLDPQASSLKRQLCPQGRQEFAAEAFGGGQTLHSSADEGSALAPAILSNEALWAAGKDGFLSPLLFLRVHKHLHVCKGQIPLRN